MGSRIINGTVMLSIYLFSPPKTCTHRTDSVFWLGVNRLPAFPFPLETVAFRAFVILTVKRAAADFHRIPVSLLRLFGKNEKDRLC